MSVVKCLKEPAIGCFKGAFGHVMSCEENMESLEAEMAELEIKRGSLRRGLEDAERESREATGDAIFWLRKFDSLQGEAAGMIEAYAGRWKVKCMCDISPNVWASYKSSKNAKKLIDRARDLEANIPHVISMERAPGRRVERLAGSMVRRDNELNRLQELAADASVRVIGVHGMGGVGKTALLDKFLNDYPPEADHLMMVVDMGDGHTVKDAQTKILEGLGLAVVETEKEEARARRIAEYLSKKTYVLILDDVWREVDLKAVGVPIGARHTKSKVIVATRIESVCNRMNAGKTKIHVKCLDEDGAWSLFEGKAGKELIESDPRIRQHAVVLVKMCGGLPCALIAAGQEMAGKGDPKLWEHAITKLENTPLEIHPMKDVHERLKRSYDNLADDGLKTCLLYCALLADHVDIDKGWIVDYCVGEGVSDVDIDVYNLLNTLQSASMLEPGLDSDEVRMHPMMRISLACTAGGKCVIRAGKGLAEAPEVDEWSGVERMSLKSNRISKLSEKPHAPRLLTLILDSNPLEEICAGFFRSMKNLRVLDLSHSKIQEVPPEIGELVQLQYLDFCDTKITSLPQVLGNLVRLRFFLLSDTPNLVSIPEGLIGKLSELRVLYMHNGFQDWKVDSTGKGAHIEELCSLRRLRAFSISIDTVAALEMLAGSSRLAECTRGLYIWLCPGLMGTLSAAWLASSFKGLEDLEISECRDLEKFLIDDGDEQSSTLPNLTRLGLDQLHIGRIAWKSGCLQNLKHLELANSSEIRQLIHCVDEPTEEDDKEEGEQMGVEDDDDEKEEEPELKEMDVLPSLYRLVLTNLQALESLSCGRRPLAFPSLEILDVEGCPNLKKLPLNAKKLRCICGSLSWWSGLEWPEKHDDVKSKFEPMFEPKYPSTWIDVPSVEMPGASGLAASDKDPHLERLEELVKDDGVSIIGIHGMGGVGKTWLLETFLDKSPLRHRYLVVWVDMDGILDAEEAQKTVSDELGFNLAYQVGLDIMIILDNLWIAVDLNCVGIPTASQHTKRKVILTTRLKDVCESMGAAMVEVKCLPWEAAWSLFVDNAGRKLIESHPLIRRHAEGMVKKCGGLPPALISVGCAMAKKKTPEKWEEAVTTLGKTPVKIRGMKNVLSSLKLSYDNLGGDKFRTCFLYLSMFPEGVDIFKRHITDYIIGEGLLEDNCCDLYSGLDVLKSASLLGSGIKPETVSMHPMICALALWIGGDKWLVRAGKKLTDAPGVDKWKGVQRISLMSNSIEALSVRPDSPSLLTLVLRHNPLSGGICNGFFESMHNLRVLDLSETGMEDVPPEIGELKELQFLDFSNTRISSLPRELGNLNKLRFLGLRNCRLLKHIPRGLIAGLTELRSLSMLHGFENWKVDSAGDGVDFEELHCPKLLNALTINVSTPSQLQSLSGSPRLADSVHGLKISSSTGLTTLSIIATLVHALRALKVLVFRRCYDLEEVVIDDGQSGHLSPLLNLTGLYLFELPKAKLTFKSGSLQNLVGLQIFRCKAARRLIHCEDESFKENDAEKEVNILPNLYELSLHWLPELESLSCGSRPLAFPSLELLDVRDCPKLKKLPLKAEKLRRIDGQASWWKSLEWPDNEAKIRSKLQSTFVERYPSSW